MVPYVVFFRQAGEQGPHTFSFMMFPFFYVTYKANKFKMPFAPFTDINQHLQPILLRGALLKNETKRQFFGCLPSFGDVRLTNPQLQSSLIRMKQCVRLLACGMPRNIRSSIFMDMHGINVKSKGWLQTMYEKHGHSIKCCMSDIFWTAITTASKSENMCILRWVVYTLNHAG